MLLLLITHQNLTIRPYVEEDTINLSHRTYRNLASRDLEASTLLASLHYVEKHYVCNGRLTVIINLT